MSVLFIGVSIIGQIECDAGRVFPGYQRLPCQAQQVSFVLRVPARRTDRFKRFKKANRTKSHVLETAETISDKKLFVIHDTLHSTGSAYVSVRVYVCVRKGEGVNPCF